MESDDVADWLRDAGLEVDERGLPAMLEEYKGQEELPCYFHGIVAYMPGKKELFLHVRRSWELPGKVAPWVCYLGRIKPHPIHNRHYDWNFGNNDIIMVVKALKTGELPKEGWF